MIKIMQIGEGNFLRTFADAYFDTLNEKFGNEYAVSVVMPIPTGQLGKFEKQNNRYHIILRGSENGNAVERVREIKVIRETVNPFLQPEKYYGLAQDESVKLVVSNTTEAGICFHEDDKADDFSSVTYPAKLTKWLYARYKAGLDGVYILPVELIDNNADELKSCVEKYISLWRLPEDFAVWNETENYYCNTLVDRIVSGYPHDEETERHLEALIGEKDELMSVGEPFGLWVIEKKGEIEKYITEGVHNIELVLTDDIGYYKKRKVRVLNGSHTNLVAAGLMHGKETVYDCVADKKFLQFIGDTMQSEIIPFVSDDIQATELFGESVIERFLNPYLNHRLESIALNSISKWRARVLPCFRDYYGRYKKIPKNLTIGFSYLIALYQTKYAELKDEKEYLECFALRRRVDEIMANKKLWGENLTQYEGFCDAVKVNVEKIMQGKCLI